MKILIYGFKPYKKWKENISENIIRKIRNRKNLKKVIFDVRFNKKNFIDEIKKFNPNIIIGLGQHPRSKKIRIERKSVNLKRENKKEVPKKISKKGPKYLFVNLKLNKDKNSWISYDAGKYVCNYSMYIISDSSKSKDVKFAFIHMPKDIGLNPAVKYIEKILQAFRD